jgi:hypothetical protein
VAPALSKLLITDTLKRYPERPLLGHDFALIYRLQNEAINSTITYIYKPFSIALLHFENCMANSEDGHSIHSMGNIARIADPKPLPKACTGVDLMAYCFFPCHSIQYNCPVSGEPDAATLLTGKDNDNKITHECLLSASRPADSV